MIINMSTASTNTPTGPAVFPPQRSAWLPASRNATIALWVAIVVAALPVIYFLFAAVISLACFSDSCSDQNMIYAVPAAALAFLMALSPFAAVRALQQPGTAPSGARTTAVVLGQVTLVWGVTGAVLALLAHLVGE
ncbi:hypothetical protein ADL15_16470 [Actinoplanes awajinensis subsp. mycoplanecinus]|uniref:Transmembrane protein n=2 Tax=Actinoplanes awajinensis TaxID=135946 RepID=A0A0X3UP09_9ACTN|nr:hypothetical protein ADL15_16470 [Actinoplanes awajinensis subsp. mycoplanecinus]